VTGMARGGELLERILPRPSDAALPAPSGHMKASSLKIKTLEGATAAALDTAVNAYTAGLGEERFLSLHVGKPDAGNYWAVIAYVE